MSYLSPSDTSSFTSSLSPASAAHTTATTMSSSSSTGSLSPSHTSSLSLSREDEEEDVVQCRWEGCSLTYDDPETLYQHLCNDHVGRKSTNNLCLTCKWVDCDVSCAKRDHITSHIRVHTPLKPHSCATCGKTFKRPQDLKKHERIHTEDHQQKQAQQRLQKQQAAAAAKESLKQANLLRQQQQQQQQQQREHALRQSQIESQQMYGMYANRGWNVPSANAGFYPALPRQSSDSGVLPSGGSMASPSPLSSHLSTPQSAHSPAHGVHIHGNNFIGTPTPVGGHPNSYLALANNNRLPPKAEDDPNSYTFLSQGTLASHQATLGLKRGYDDLLQGVDGLFEDAKKKRSTANYNSSMADKLTSTFGATFDDSTLQALLNPSNDVQGFSTGYHAPQQTYQTQPQQAPSTLEPSANDPSKLVDLNNWLLQMGVSASRGLNNAQQQQPPVPQQPAQQQSSFDDFDLSSLTAAGLNSIPGFDESLFNFDARPIANMPRHSTGSYGPSHATLYTNAPQHSQSFSAPSNPVPSTASQSYASSSSTANASNNASLQHPHSFDSMRPTRGPGVVPTLARMDPHPNFRHVEPLMRAAPSSSTATLERGKSPANMLPKLQPARHSPSASPSSSPAEMAAPRSSLYPSLTSLVDGSDTASPRRLTPSDNQTSLPPISSLIAAASSPGSAAWSSHRNARQSSFDSETVSAASPAASESTSSASPVSRSRSSSPMPSKVYPSIPTASPHDDTSDRIARLGLSSGLQSLAEAASSAAASNSNEEVPIEVRRKHIQLIKTLLVAINFPERFEALMAKRQVASEHEGSGNTASTNAAAAAADDNDNDDDDDVDMKTSQGQRTPRATSPEPERDTSLDQQVSTERKSDWLRTVTNSTSPPAPQSRMDGIDI